ELGELHRDLAVERTLTDRRKHPGVVIGDAVGILELRQVLTEMGEQEADPVGLVSLARIDGGPEILARHESEDSAAGKPETGQPVSQPSIPGHPEQDPAHGPPRSVAMAASPTADEPCGRCLS